MLNKAKENTLKRKDKTLLIIVIVISIIMLFSLVQSLFYENRTIESRFWVFICITSLFFLGSFAFIILEIMLTKKFKEADKSNSSAKDFKTIIRRKFKYIIIILLYTGFFMAVGTIISEQAISTFLEPGLFPSDLYAFLLLTGLTMTFLLQVVLVFFEAKVTQKKNNL